MSDEKEEEKPVNDTESLAQDIEKVLEKYDVKSYVIIADKLGPVVLYKPDDIMEITRILKSIHEQFRHKVLQSIGEA